MSEPPDAPLRRACILPEPDLPAATDLVAEGRRLAAGIRVGPSPFLAAHGVDCECAYKRMRMGQGAIMFHAQVGFRDPEKSRRACAEIHERLAAAGHRVDRYGICLDWSMGYPAARRAGMPRGTGLILDGPEDFRRLTAMAPVAPHFGDFVMGMPAALENTAAALAAGSTAIGNLGQYFTFRLPHWGDDVATTAATVTAMALCAAQPVPVLIHSNLDDGFAALYRDMASGLGQVMIERHVVEGLIGGASGHCYGHTFSDPVTRFAFQRALALIEGGPGTMIYGNTTAYRAGAPANYAALAAYMTVDILAQRGVPTGHALNPVPVTEAERIPEIDEIVDAHLFANRLAPAADGLAPLVDAGPAEEIARRLVEGGRRFRDNVLAGLAEAGIDTADAFQVLLALRRIGARRLEALFGGGAPDGAGRRRPVVPATTLGEVEADAARRLAALNEAARGAIGRAGLRACVATTDVHEYGKVLVETMLAGLGVAVIDGGVSVDPNRLAARAAETGAHLIALGTYNGVALDYLRGLKRELAARALVIPVFVGGKLNQVPSASNTSLPVDVSAELAAEGAICCRRVEDLVDHLHRLVEGKALP